jgi:hypothetical protein
MRQVLEGWISLMEKLHISSYFNGLVSKPAWTERDYRSLPLRERCPAGQRGVPPNARQICCVHCRSANTSTGFAHRRGTPLCRHSPTSLPQGERSPGVQFCASFTLPTTDNYPNFRHSGQAASPAEAVAKAEARSRNLCGRPWRRQRWRRKALHPAEFAVRK